MSFLWKPLNQILTIKAHPSLLWWLQSSSRYRRPRTSYCTVAEGCKRCYSETIRSRRATTIIWMTGKKYIAKKAHQGTDALQRSPKVRHDDAPQSDRRRTDAPKSVHKEARMPEGERPKALHGCKANKAFTTWPEVSKNAFVEPFSALQNYVANYPKELTHTHK